MSKLPSQCPSCSAQLVVARLTCPACSMQLEGSFELHQLLQLPEQDLRFVLDFVTASGSLKEVAKQYKQSYPTIRNRLNGVIDRLGKTPHSLEHARNEILDAIARGDLSVEEAAKKLKEVGS